MSSTYSDLLRLEKMTAGENDDTWGDRANVVFELIEDAIAKREIITLSASDVVLSANNGATDQARALCLALNGTLTANINVIVPSSSKFYLVTNNCTGAFSVTVKTAAGTGILVAQGGNPALLYCDGTNVLSVSPAFVALLNVSQNWTAAQAVTPATLTDGASIAVNASLSNKFRVTLGGNRTLSNPTAAKDGQVIEILVIQDATGSRTLAYASKYIFPGGTPPTLTTTANRADLLIFSYDLASDKWLGSSIANYAI